MKIDAFKGTLIALAAASLFAGCAQKTGTGAAGAGTGGPGAAMDSKNGCKGHDSCKASDPKERMKGDNCNSADGCGASDK